MSVALTTQAVIDRQKTVTRRLGWWLVRFAAHPMWSMKNQEVTRIEWEYLS